MVKGAGGAGKSTGGVVKAPILKSERLKRSRDAMKAAAKDMQEYGKTNSVVETTKKAVFEFVSKVEKGSGGEVMAALSRQELQTLLKIVEHTKHNNVEAKLVTVGQAVFTKEFMMLEAAAVQIREARHALQTAFSLAFIKEYMADGGSSNWKSFDTDFKKVLAKKMGTDSDDGGDELKDRGFIQWAW